VFVESLMRSLFRRELEVNGKLIPYHKLQNFFSLSIP